MSGTDAGGHGPGGLFRGLRSSLAPAAKTVMLRSGAFHALRTLLPNRGVGILRYHAVAGPEGRRYASADICVSPSAFEAQVRYLAANYHVLPLPDVVASLSAGKTVPANTVVLTFDDGYADNFEAARVMRRHGVSGTFYLTAGCLQGGQPFWPAELRYLVAAIQEPSVVLKTGAESLPLTLTTKANRDAAVSQLTRLFKSRPIDGRERLRDALRHAAGNPTIPNVMLTWEQVREMHAWGMTIGSHTVTHPNLPSAGLTDAGTELRESRVRLEQEVGAPVTMFSYPNGGAERYYTPDLQRIVRECGYEAATTSRNGFAGAGSDLYALERVQVAERLEDLVYSLEIDRLGALGARTA